MRRALFAFALVLVLVAAPAGAQQPTAEQAQTAQAALTAAEPGPEHRRLARLAGTWDVEWAGPGIPGTKATGVVENRMILGNRFLESRTQGPVGPARVESLTLYGFDRRYQRYTVVGYDTFGTYYITAAGTLAEASRTVTMRGTLDDPSGKRTEAYEMHVRFVDDDTFITDVVFTDGTPLGVKGPVKVVEAVHRRRRS